MQPTKDSISTAIQDTSQPGKSGRQPIGMQVKRLTQSMSRLSKETSIPHRNVAVTTAATTAVFTQRSQSHAQNMQDHWKQLQATTQSVQSSLGIDFRPFSSPKIVLTPYFTPIFHSQKLPRSQPKLSQEELREKRCKALEKARAEKERTNKLIEIERMRIVANVLRAPAALAASVKEAVCNLNDTMQHSCAIVDACTQKFYDVYGISYVVDKVGPPLSRANEGYSRVLADYHSIPKELTDQYLHDQNAALLHGALLASTALSTVQVVRCVKGKPPVSGVKPITTPPVLSLQPSQPLPQLPSKVYYYNTLQFDIKLTKSGTAKVDFKLIANRAGDNLPELFSEFNTMKSISRYKFPETLSTIKNISTAAGAQVVKVKASFANERLMELCAKRFGLISKEGFEEFTFPIPASSKKTAGLPQLTLKKPIIWNQETLLTMQITREAALTKAVVSVQRICDSVNSGTSRQLLMDMKELARKEKADTLHLKVNIDKLTEEFGPEEIERYMKLLSNRYRWEFNAIDGSILFEIPLK